LAGLPWPVFEEVALTLCARKVAAATGDMRRALNICTLVRRCRLTLSDLR